MKLKRNEEALTELTKALQLNSSYPKALINRGDVNLKLENFEDAIRDY